VRASRLSRYEPELNRDMIFDLTSEIEDLIDRTVPSNEIKSRKKLLFGSLPTGDLNACFIKFDNPEYHVVLVEEGLFGFANMLAKAVAQALPVKPGGDGSTGFSVDPTEIRSHLAHNQDAEQRLSELMLSLAISGHAHAAAQYLADRAYLPVISIWCNAIEMFVLARAYGHCMLGHLDLDDLAKIHRDGFVECATSGQELVDAESVALHVVLTRYTERGGHAGMAYVGIELFLMSLDVLEEIFVALDRVEYGESTRTKYPRGATRRESLRSVLPAYLGGEQGRIAAALASNFEEVMQMMRPMIMNMAVELEKNGRRPDARWMGGRWRPTHPPSARQ
jgi:hypothetical protein